MNTFVLILAILFILPGILGVILPFLPGIPYMFLVALIYGILTRFQTLTSHEIIILAVIALFSLIIDYLSGIFGAKFGGAHKTSIWYGFVGLIIGTFILPPLGGIIGLFVGVFAGEISAHQNRDKAVKVATSSLIGTLAGIALNLILSIIFLILFVVYSLN